MRRFVVVAVALGVVAAGCVSPPPSGGSNPFACSVEPVDLGPANRVEAVSADGEVIVVNRFANEGGSSYDVIDRRAGSRYTMKTTGPLGDGAQIFMNDAGTLIYGYQYATLQPGELPWFRHDIATRTTTSIEPAGASSGLPNSFSSDLRSFVVQSVTPPDAAPVKWDLVQFLTGATTPLGVSTDPAWRTAGFSPDLSLVVQYSAPSSNSKSVRVLDTATGAVALDVGRVVNENSSYVSTRFVDDTTLLVNDAVPYGAPPDGISTDGAFLIDIPTGNVTRIDPGVEKASTSQATPDGKRSVFAIINRIETWVRLDGQNQLLIETFSGTANNDITVVVTADNGRAALHCF